MFEGGALNDGSKGNVRVEVSALAIPVGLQNHPSASVDIENKSLSQRVPPSIVLCRWRSNAKAR
jgi:hypothetical protein